MAKAKAKKRSTRARPTTIRKAPPKAPGREPGRGKKRGPLDPPRRGYPR
jgi:hypothetical protein